MLEDFSAGARELPRANIEVKNPILAATVFIE